MSILLLLLIIRHHYILSFHQSSLYTADEGWSGPKQVRASGKNSCGFVLVSMYIIDPLTLKPCVELTVIVNCYDGI